MLNVLVTGGEGFIGSNLIDSLLRYTNYRICVIDNLLTGKKENLGFTTRNLIIFNGSIEDKVFVSNIFRGFMPNVVIHAAASYNNPADWQGDIATNIVGMANLVQTSTIFGVDKFIYLQTSLCYGLDPLSVPMKVGDPYFNGDYNGGSSYGISKTAGELYLSISELNYVSFRLANVYGPRNFSGPIPIFFSEFIEG